jgi:hypothetical protein
MSRGEAVKSPPDLPANAQWCYNFPKLGEPSRQPCEVLPSVAHVDDISMSCQLQAGGKDMKAT